MANNRMYLLHRPTGLAAFLGKRMGWGWYTATPAERVGTLVERLFAVLDDIGYSGEQDDFCLAMEDAEGATMADDGWRYEQGYKREDGLTQLNVGGRFSREDAEAYAAKNAAAEKGCREAFEREKAEAAVRIPMKSAGQSLAEIMREIHDEEHEG